MRPLSLLRPFYAFIYAFFLRSALPGCRSGSWQEAKTSVFKELIPLLTFIKEVLLLLLLLLLPVHIGPLYRNHYVCVCICVCQVDPLTIPMKRIRRAVRASSAATATEAVLGQGAPSAATLKLLR